MKKVYLIIFTLLAFPFFQAKADLLIEKDSSKYYYQKEVCNTINNLDELLNSYNFYYINSSPISSNVSVKKLDNSTLSKISKCLEVYTGGNYGSDLVLVSKKDNDLITKYTNSIKEQNKNEQFAALSKLKDSGSIIYLNKSPLEFSSELSVDKTLFAKQPDNTYENNYYNLTIDVNNKAIFTKTSGSVVKKESNKSMENIAITVVITSFISIIVLLVIQRKLNKKVNE